MCGWNNLFCGVHRDMSEDKLVYLESCIKNARDDLLLLLSMPEFYDNAGKTTVVNAVEAAIDLSDLVLWLKDNGGCE